MSRERSDCAISLRECQALWRLTGDALLVERIEQRQRIRLPCQDPSKQSVEGRRGLGLDHGMTLVAGPAFAPRVPDDLPSTQWPVDVRSRLPGPSVARRRQKAELRRSPTSGPG